MNTVSKPKDKESRKEVTNDPHILILHNDDHNSFENVIFSLMKHCNHTKEQAEQVANIVHFTGKCDVKRGEKDKIKKLYNLLKGEGLTVSIESK